MQTCNGLHLFLGTFQTPCSFPSNVHPNHPQPLGSHPYIFSQIICLGNIKKPYHLPYTQAKNWPPSFEYPPKMQGALLAWTPFCTKGYQM